MVKTKLLIYWNKPIAVQFWHSRVALPPLLLLKLHSRTQTTSKCGKNKEMAQDCVNLGFLFLTLEVSCCLSPNVRTVTQSPLVWNKAIVIKSLILGILILKQEGTNHFAGENMITFRGVGWPFWQLRTQVHMVFKTSYKITFLLSFNTQLPVYRLVYNKTWYQKKLLKRSSLSWYRNIYQHKATRLFCKKLSLKKNTTSVN